MLFFLVSPSEQMILLNSTFEPGADPNRASYLSTPLGLVASQCGEGIIRCLLKAGADPNILDPIGHKPIEYATWNGRREAVEILFPVTSRIACYPNWSVDGILLHAKSGEGRARLLSKQKKLYILAKAKGEEAFKKSPVNYYDIFNWYYQAHISAPTDHEILSNLSLCHAMMYLDDSALKYAKDCIELKPRWAKAHFREGIALKVLKEFKMEAKAFTKAENIDPRDKEINKELRYILISSTSLCCSLNQVIFVNFIYLVDHKAVRAEIFSRKH
ncbi:hypothetical protein OROMI_008813 [Orobanche minor]